MKGFVWIPAALGRVMSPPLKESILASAVDFPIVEPHPSGEPQTSNARVVDEKQANNKLARFLKLHPKP